MPLINARTPAPASPDDMAHWKPLHRIEDTGGDVQVVIEAINQFPFERLLYAEGDSWFDKFTPIPVADTNLLSALRLPCFAGVVDVSHIGDTSDQMVTGWQLRQTRAMFKLFDFDAILLSAGGNDLKNLFATLYSDLGDKRGGKPVASPSELLHKLDQGQPVDEFFDGVEAHIRSFTALRDNSPRDRTRRAPLFLHGYDHLQPRPAPGHIFAGTSLGRGPWLYPSMKHAGLNDAQMLVEAKGVINELNARLTDLVSSLGPAANVTLLDQRGVLQLAAAGSSGESNDWIDEIHPTPRGFAKLAQARWNGPLARALNLI